MVLIFFRELMLRVLVLTAKSSDGKKVFAWLRPSFGYYRLVCFGGIFVVGGEGSFSLYSQDRVILIFSLIGPGV